MSAEGSEDTPRRSPDALRLLSAVGSPIALGTALLLYFGWVRSEAQARAFGADASVFDLAPQDLALRSIDVLFFPILLLLGLGLLAVRLDPWLRRHAGIAAPILRNAWVLVPAGLVMRFLAPAVGDVVFPLWVLLAIGGTAYGSLLRRHARGDRRPAHLGYVSLVVAMLTLSLFWQTERLAWLAGEALANDLKEHLADRQPSVSLISVAGLHIDAAGVVETELGGGTGDAYRYRYDGLYFLQRSGEKYFLLTDGWNDDEGRLIVVTDTEGIRLEFGE